jgi:hypothetical protein
MTFDEVAASLPNGFHDAELRRFEMDHLHRTLQFDLVVGSATWMIPDVGSSIAQLA